MVHGYFLHGINLPYVEVSIFSGKKISRSAFVLDTGFSGDIKIDERMADEFGIIPVDEVDTINANGERVRVGFANGYAEMEDRKILVDILIFGGPPLAGMGLFWLFSYKVVVDPKNRTAHLESVI